MLNAGVLAMPAAHNILDNLASLDKIYVPATMTPASNERYRKVTSKQVPPPARACCLEAVSSVMSCLAPETPHSNQHGREGAQYRLGKLGLKMPCRIYQMVASPQSPVARNLPE